MIIIGAGISGLHIGIEVLKKYPNKKCYILEKYKVNGGRVLTHYKEQWEIGAGRIAKSHKKIIKLCKQYNVSLIEQSSISSILPHTPNPFFVLYSVYVEPLKKLSKITLQTNTLGVILDNIHGKIVAKKFYFLFPYYGEIHTLRADIALELFQTVMGKTEQFYGAKEGLSKIIQGMTDEFIKNGGIILNEMEVIQIIPTKTIKVICKNAIFNTDCCVLALPSEDIKQLLIDPPQVLSKLKMLPLVRIYAVFPIQNGKTWFTGMGKMIVSTPIRYIIPISSNTIMISYTDGLDAEYWLKQSHELIQSIVMKEIRKLFPNMIIPEPIVCKIYPWKNGCTYWLPGKYDVEKESNKSLHPISGPLFMASESFAVKQCWMESALDQSDKLLQLESFIKAIHKDS